MLKRIQCKNGILEFHYDMELANRLFTLSDRAREITERAEKSCVIARKKGIQADLTECWRQLGIEFERVFGRGSCRIVFGGDLVSSDMLMEFADKINLCFEQWNKEMQT